jgi:hypothetical protein
VNDKEQRLVAAHKRGREAGLKTFANVVDEAAGHFENDDEQACYIAALLGEMRRLLAIRESGIK